MAFAQRIITSNSAGDQEFTFTFDYIKEEHIKVFVNFVEKTQGTGSNEFQVITNTTPKKISLNTGLSADNTRVEIKRISSLSTPLVDFADGSTLTAADLDTAEKQSLFIDQELDDALKQGVSIDPTTGLPTLSNQRLTNVLDPVNAQDVVTKAYLERTGSITSTQIANGTIVDGDIANTTITGGKLANDTITSTQIGANAVTASELADDAVDTNAVQDDAITYSKIQNVSATNRILGRDSSGAGVIEEITPANLRTMINVEDGATADQSAAEIKSLIASSPLDASHLAANSVDSSELVDGSVDHSHLSNDCVDGDNVQDDSIDNEHIAANAVRVNEIKDGEITSAKLNPSAVITESEQASATTNDTSFLTSAAADARFFNISSGDTIKDGQSFPDNDTTIATTAAINDRIIDLVDDVGGFVPIANETSFPTANPDAENGTGTIVSVKAASTDLTPSGTTVTIANGAGTGNTVTITGVPSVISSGFGFLVETTTTTHTYTFHRLVPNATEVTAVAGKAVEIGRLGTADAVADMALLGTTDVIADMNLLATSDVVADMALLATTDVIADMALLAVADVISDMNLLATSDNITAMDTCRDNISSITNASNNISSVNNFGDKYQVASSDPSTDGGGNALAAGDLYFNDSVNELKVYNGSQWQGGVTATGNFASITGNTFTGDNIYNDNVKAKFGTGADLQIFHDGTGCNIRSTSSKLEIRSPDLILQNSAAEKYFRGISDGAVELYHNNSKKFETSSSGATLTGNLVVTGTVDGVDIAALNTTVANITTDLVSDTSPQLGGDLDTNGFEIDLDDDHSINFGNDDDLKIKHSGSNGNINNYNGDLVIRTLGSGDDIFIDSNDDVSIRTHATDNAIKCLGDGGVELYYDSVKKLETTSDGITIAGSNNARFGDNGKLKLGASDDLEIYHDGTGCNIRSTSSKLEIRSPDLILQNSAAEKYFRGISDGAVELYYDNSKMFETLSVGTKTYGQHQISTGDNSYLALLNTNGQGTSYIRNYQGNLLIESPNNITLELGSSSEIGLYAVKNGSVSLYYDNSKRLETTTTGWKTQKAGSAECIIGSTDGDGAYLYLDGDANGDASGSDYAYIGMTNQGVLRIHNFKNEDLEFANNNIVRARFTSSGHFVPQANNTYDLGSTGARWANVYTNDLNLSNEGGKNDVDGTWGSYTIQEGAEDLFLINKRNGKKYKFALAEVA